MLDAKDSLLPAARCGGVQMLHPEQDDTPVHLVATRRVKSQLGTVCSPLAYRAGQALVSAVGATRRFCGT